MKVLHVDPADGWRGGERQVRLLARGLGRRGLRNVVVAAPGSPLARHAREDGIDVHEIRMRGDVDPAAIVALRNCIAREKPDVLHLHTARAHAVGGLAARGAGARPRVLVTRRVELVTRGPFGRWKYRRLGDHYVAISRAVLDSLRAAGVPPERITLIPSGVELPESPSGPAGRPGEWVVGTLAAFTPQKDPDTWTRAAVRLARKVPDVRFVWAGTGELRPRVEGAIREAGLSTKVELPGFLADPEPVWRRLDAFFLPSAFEALGTVILDAMARALPVVATRVGGIPEVVRDGVEGLLAEPGDDAGLAEALRRLKDEPDLAARLGAAGRRRAEDFDIEGIVDRILELYERQLAGVPR